MKLPTSITLFLCLLLSIGAAETPDVKPIAAWVNGSPIHEAQVREKMAGVVRLLEQRSSRPIDDSIRQKIQKKALDRLIEQNVVLTSERASGIQFSDDEIQAHQADAIRQKALGSIDQFKAFLSSKQISWTVWQRDQQENMMLNAVRESLVKSLSAYESTEVETFFNENQARFYNGGRVKISLIVLDPKAAQEGNPRRFSTGVQNRLFDAGNDEWEACATEYSCGPNAASGGHLDWLPPADLPFEFAKTVGHMQIGEIEKIAYGDYYYFLRLDAVEKKRPLTFAEAKPQVETIMMKRKGAQAWKSWLQTEVQKADVRRTTARKP